MGHRIGLLGMLLGWAMAIRQDHLAMPALDLKFHW
jgi:hypothetical protein